MADNRRLVAQSTKLTQAERALVRAAADVEGLTPSAWIRRQVVAAARRRLETEIGSQQPIPAS